MHTPDDHPRPGWYCSPEEYSNALRTLHLHGMPMLHDWLLHLENEVIDLLPPDEHERFRASQ